MQSQNNESSKQVKLGALISYIVIAFNIVAGLIYTPWMISKIGQSNYGLYTLATSLITLFVVDFGMGAAVSRFVSKYIAEGKQEEINNFLGVVYKLYILIDLLIFIILFVLYFFIDSIYGQLTGSEIKTFKLLYIVVGLFSVISFPFTNLNGVLTSYEKFVPLKLCDLFHKAFIIIAMVIALLFGAGVYVLVLINAIAGILTIVIKLIIIRAQTSARINWSYFDKGVIKSIFSFSLWTTVAALAQRLIYNITPSIIAAVSPTGSTGVALFGLGSTIEGYVYSIATAISGMFMPKISRMIYGEKKEDLTPLMIRVGRIQCMIIGLFLVGFVGLGRSFIADVWRKPDFDISYFCAMFLIIPSYFYVPMEIANTALVVENKVKLQAFIFIVMGLTNVVLSLILSRYFGALGAAISIFVAYTLRTILMVVVYQKQMGLHMWTFYKETFIKITPWLLILLVGALALEYFNPMSASILRFLVNGCILVLFYGIIMIVFVWNKSEKKLFTDVFGKALKKRKR